MGFFTEDESNADEFARIDELDKEAEASKQSPEQKPKDQPNNTETVPAKYKGKTVEEIIRMHQEAEGLIKRHADEVGFAREMARKAAERLESENGSQSKRTDVDQDDPVEYFADPKKAVEKTISNHPDIVAARESVRQSNAEKALSKVVAKVGDPAVIMGDPDFLPWLQENSFRANALRHANENSDADAAIEIFSSFKLAKQVKDAETQKSTNEVKGKQEKAKTSMMVDGGSSPGPDTGKIYRASDLRKLQNKDPNRCEKLEAEIMRAYAEKRVVFD